jgi:hypothetical protein
MDKWILCQSEWQEDRPIQNFGWDILEMGWIWEMFQPCCRKSTLICGPIYEQRMACSPGLLVLLNVPCFIFEVSKSQEVLNCYASRDRWFCWIAAWLSLHHCFVVVGVKDSVCDDGGCEITELLCLSGDLHESKLCQDKNDYDNHNIMKTGTNFTKSREPPEGRQ